MWTIKPFLNNVNTETVLFILLCLPTEMIFNQFYSITCKTAGSASVFVHISLFDHLPWLYFKIHWCTDVNIWTSCLLCPRFTATIMARWRVTRGQRSASAPAQDSGELEVTHLDVNLTSPPSHGALSSGIEVTSWNAWGKGILITACEVRHPPETRYASCFNYEKAHLGLIH